MVPNPDAPIHPDVRKLVDDIAKMSDEVQQTFEADPDKLRRFNAGYLRSMERVDPRRTD